MFNGTGAKNYILGRRVRKNPDLKIARDEFIGILENGESCFADKGFQDQNYFKTPFIRPITEFAKIFNQQHKKEMACHEDINKRIKQFRILQSFRHRADFKHNIVFGTIIQLEGLVFWAVNVQSVRNLCSSYLP